jgi:hypothetical protein
MSDYNTYCKFTDYIQNYSYDSAIKMYNDGLPINHLFMGGQSGKTGLALLLEYGHSHYNQSGKERHHKFMNLVSELMKRGADPLLAGDTPVSKGQTFYNPYRKIDSAVYYAVYYNMMDVLELFVKYGITFGKYETLILMPCFNANYDLFRFLAVNGISLKCKTYQIQNETLITYFDRIYSRVPSKNNENSIKIRKMIVDGLDATIKREALEQMEAKKQADAKALEELHKKQKEEQDKQEYERKQLELARIQKEKNLELNYYNKQVEFVATLERQLNSYHPYKSYSQNVNTEFIDLSNNLKTLSNNSSLSRSLNSPDNIEEHELMRNIKSVVANIDVHNYNDNPKITEMFSKITQSQFNPIEEITNIKNIIDELVSDMGSYDDLSYDEKHKKINETKQILEVFTQIITYQFKIVAEKQQNIQQYQNNINVISDNIRKNQNQFNQHSIDVAKLVQDTTVLKSSITPINFQPKHIASQIHTYESNITNILRKSDDIITQMNKDIEKISTNMKSVISHMDSIVLTNNEQLEKRENEIREFNTTFNPILNECNKKLEHRMKLLDQSLNYDAKEAGTYFKMALDHIQSIISYGDNVPPDVRKYYGNLIAHLLIETKKKMPPLALNKLVEQMPNEFKIYMTSEIDILPPWKE